MAPGFEPGPLVALTIIMILIYFLPAVASGIMRHKYSTRIIVANIFLGWTIIGWLICLIYALWGANGEPFPEDEELE